MQKSSAWLPVVLQVKLYILSIIYVILKQVEIAVFDTLHGIWNSIFPGTCPKKAISDVENLILWWVRFPFKVMYYIYIFPFVFVVQNYFLFLAWSVKLILEQNAKLNQISTRLQAAQTRVEELVVRVLSSKLSEFVPFLVNVILEAIISFFWPPQKSDFDHSYSLDDLSELMAYEEYDAEESENNQSILTAQNNNNSHFAKSLLLMHTYIPTKPFRATVRRVRKVPEPIPSSGTSSASISPLALVPSLLKHRGSAARSKRSTTSATVSTAVLTTSQHGSTSPTQCLMSTYDMLGADSPASFPSTPFSRAYVMNKSSEKVVSVMFAARDKLRLEAQSVSRDEYSSMVAREAKTSGQLAMFDDTQTSSGIALSCGNHCAMKVGLGLCASCRSKAPVRTNSFVYLEFSITVSNAQVPNLGVGLAPLDSPLNVMVGSWPKSLGLYTDGQLWIGSQSQLLGVAGEYRMSAGSTVGMLVHITEENCDSPIARLRADSKFTNPLRSPRLVPVIEVPSQPVTAGSGSGSSGASSTPSINEVKNVVVGIADLESSEISSDDTTKALPEVHQSYETAVEPTSSADATGNSVVPGGGRSRENNDLLKNALMRSSQKQNEVPDLSLPSESPSVARKTLRLSIPKPTPSAGVSTVAARMNMQFNINGKVVELPREVREIIGEIPSCSSGGGVAATTLYPTVSILTEDTRVWCRFCAEDVVYRSRKAIGAPEGVRVYCLDGSLLIKETD